MVNQKDIVLKTELQLAFFHERACYQIQESKQGQALQGMGLEGMGGWESLLLFDFLYNVHMFVCVSMCVFVSV